MPRNPNPVPETGPAKPARPFKSAEKPVSLYPLSFKQAVVALLQLGPIPADLPAKSETPGADIRKDREGSRR